jgi:uncharacterized SAM-binding protein YcdF (DUF218 family)
MSFLVTKIVSAFVLPPLNLLVVSGVGLCLLKTRPRLGRNLILVSWLLLYALSTPIIAMVLRRPLENTPTITLTDTPANVDAIVVLSGGIYLNAPEYEGDSVNGYVLERLRYAARLHRATGKPILVTGGNPRQATKTEAQVMQESLSSDFFIPVQWVEDQSNTTLDNARLSAPVLQQHGIRRIYLVTHAVHMPRARAAFERAGFEIVPAPTMFTTRAKLIPLDFLPQGPALAMSYYTLHEVIGQVWSWLQG